ncbi:2-oxoacid:ferredoxin oxidoreductase subunit beta [Ilyobacter polytropus]|uniref:2-oxoglutarate ferredoxin oxidoreductase, beta subunit n=1 Tax=Ilyobacter polytropus (strain ATCC 51220 / DSM 2926 / LMG 16218 / CuHBu1) TaxID=572544 RepID=E3H6J1_ILYPC|nr:2-oxoacid:ferredoxin oxidoreductase subunit beta [Ilyobacter polytropus]ADO81876.1 2-oxoglutarate ferredoxin oxidoreductase, beta subunit [Ilyobacter polytropus DSM 2926]ADO82880.1 2-oxoglutarate ferredoxin oxidoreductase, beta subunit [Ilyobacter polytropus DSM 2926]ADO84473.1 2-oxoglutarate ferredoxin oxidoreductase, beta subunit [Ilyobacter polytropus DSM 2926]
MDTCKNKSYYREDKLPHIWCPGCAHGIVMHALVNAIENIGLNKDDVCVVSGIGCSSRAPGYLDFNTLHTTHGRSLAFATGIKMAKPGMKVIALGGDGDFTAIGGNHLIHAARRNIDIAAIIFNNNIYGMTGGQFSPTTPVGDYATTTPTGNIDPNFDIVKLVDGAGASYVARGTAYHFDALVKLFENAINHKGFSLVEAVSTCPTSYGRKNKGFKGNPAAMLKYMRDNTVPVAAVAKLPKEKVEGKLVIGEFKNEQRPEYTEEYQKIIDKVRGV